MVVSDRWLGVKELADLLGVVNTGTFGGDWSLVVIFTVIVIAILLVLRSLATTSCTSSLLLEWYDIIFVIVLCCAFISSHFVLLHLLVIFLFLDNGFVENSHVKQFRGKLKIAALDMICKA